MADLTISLFNIPSPGASQFCQVPFSIGWGKGRVFDLVVKIQYLDYTMDDRTDVNVPTPWIMFLCQYPFQGCSIPQLGEVGHIIDSRITCIVSMNERSVALGNSSCIEVPPVLSYLYQSLYIVWPGDPDCIYPLCNDGSCVLGNCQCYSSSSFCTRIKYWYLR